MNTKRIFSARMALRRPAGAFATCLFLLLAGNALADGPSAGNVSVSGALKVGQTLSGSYQYSDPEGDPEGNSRYTWISYPNFGGRCFGFFGNVVGSARQYSLGQADLGRCLAFQVTPVAQYDSDPGDNDVEGTTVRSPIVGPVAAANTPPQITGQNPLSTDENQPLTLRVSDFSIADPDNGPGDFSLVVEDGDNYRVSGTTITPDNGFDGNLTVRVRASDGEDTGPVFNASVEVVDVSEPPQINGQNTIRTDEDTPRELTVDDFDISDPDSDLDDLTIIVSNGNNYSVNGSTITPAANFSGTLTVSVRANDGSSNSNRFDATVTVVAVNDRPRISGQTPDPVPAQEDTTFELGLGNVSVADPDNDYPGDFTFAIQPGENYTAAGNIVTPAPDFDGRLQVFATVADTEGAQSDPFGIEVEIAGENDAPSIVDAIADSTAVENTPFELDVSANFADIDGDDLSFEASWADAQPPNISFDGNSGRFFGTPQLEDTEAPGPVYNVTVTARDPAGEFIVDAFVLTVSALDRANLALDIAVTPETGEPGDEFVWTFTSTNPVGPQAGSTVEVAGTFTGTSVATVSDAGSDCSITPDGDRVTSFRCQVGALPVGNSASIGLRTTVNAVTEVLVSATTASATSVPIDPNMDDNTKASAIGVGDAFSAGAAESVGGPDVVSLAAGDLNGDGRTDIAVGTTSGQPVQVYLADGPRPSCNCYRDYVGEPRNIASTGEANGIALADFDGNGTLDIAIANGNGQADEVFANDGAGNFTNMATLGASFGRALATGDFNNDGNPDIVVATAAGNPVYLGDGNGGFSLESSLGNADSYDVAVARLSDDELDDIVVANNGSSQVWVRQAGSGFASSSAFNIGFASSVATADLDSDGRMDIVFGRTFAGGSPPSNPVYFNNGNGRFGGPDDSLALSPTVDVATGDIDRDGRADIVFINESGVHQVWLQRGGVFELAAEQIIDIGANAVVVGEFGDIAESDAGGNDIVIGGGDGAGLGIYLNDGGGNLGRGDTVAPELSLVGESTISVPASGVFNDPGTLAIDNIDGDISGKVVSSSNINPSIVGTYTVTYNVSDFAGNAAPSITRNVNVEPAAGTGGGGGGGAVSPLALAFGALLSLGLLGLQARRVRRERRIVHIN